MSDGQTQAAAIEASRLREAAERDALSHRALAKYALSPIRGEDEASRWMRAFFAFDDANAPKPFGQSDAFPANRPGLEEQAAKVTEKTRGLLALETLSELRAALEAIPLTPAPESPVNVGKALGCVVKLEELLGAKGGE